MDKEHWKPFLWFRTILGVAVLVVLLLAAGGRLDYWQAWVYILINVFFIALTNWLLRDNPELLIERMFPGKGIKAWDRIFRSLSTPLYFVTLIVAAVDAGRSHWTHRLPPAFYACAIAFYCWGQALMLWAKRSNNFFSSVVRIQNDRGQTVSCEGPYRYVRHPGYLGSLAFGLSAPLLLGSLLALIPSILAAALLVARTVLEDNTLLTELDGYREYANAVRFRLLPYLW